MSDSSAKPQITVSIVSHGHGQMLWDLVQKLNCLESALQIVVTLNIPQSVPEKISEDIQIICNPEPIGFGANHNQAFKRCKTDFFAVINPDIDLIHDPFPELIQTLMNDRIGVVGPKVINIQGESEDSLRAFPLPINLLKRYLIPGYKENFFRQGNLIFPEWIAGMFMLFRAEDYQAVNGFDTNYFMYCEDADICTRLWFLKRGVAVNPFATVIHNAQRASRKSLRHLRWHTASLLRYALRYSQSYPNLSKSTDSIDK